MGVSSQTSHDLVHRLCCLGISKTTSKQIVEEFQGWRRDSGDEWTCAHVKELKVELIRFMGGLPPSTSVWIERRKDKVTPTGAFGALWKISRKRPFSALNAMQIYTSLVYKPSGDEPKITPKQLKGFEEALHRPSLSKEAIAEYQDLLQFLPMEFHGDLPEFEAPQVLDVPVKPFKRSPIPERGLVPKEDVFPRALTLLSLTPSFYNAHLRLIDSALGMMRNFVPLKDLKEAPESISPSDSIPVVLNKIQHSLEHKDGFSADPSDIISGNVAFIQDSGYKLRHIFVTNELLQIAALPLQEFLMKQLRHIPQDATYDQDAAVLRVKEYLSQGYTAHCYDLQKCSDNLPRRFQYMLFKHLGLQDEWIQFFRDVTSSRWEIRDRIPTDYPIGKKKFKETNLLPSSAKFTYRTRKDPICVKVRMTVGQQLGFGPSFPAFSLLHHSIVRALARKFDRPLSYVLLGDDIVIFDSILAEKYTQFMGLCGVPISSSKTIISNQLAEFAGRLIYPDKVVPTYKWKGRCSDNNFLDICRALGPRSLGLLKPRQRFIAEVLGWIPEPFGLGWNPQGLSYEQRIKDTEELWLKLIEEKDIRVRHYQHRTRRVNRMIYEYPDWTQGLYLEPSSDQDDYATIKREFPSRSSIINKMMPDLWYLFLPNIDYLARSLDVGSLNSVEISGLLARYSWIEKLSSLTSLTIYERKLFQPKTVD